VDSTDKRQEGITYFPAPGYQNTEALLAVVAERVRRRDIDAVVVATSSGRTALLARQAIADPNARVIGICFQRHLEGSRTMLDPELRAQAAELGVTFLPDEPRVRYLDEVYPQAQRALWCFGDGVKVAFEVAMIAVEAGLIAPGTKIVGVGGTKPGRHAKGGADSALVLTAADYAHLRDVFVHEILAKPVQPKLSRDDR
jgi:hypothetical protein